MEWPVFAFWVEYDDSSPEDGLAKEVGLYECALATTDLAENEHVRIREDAEAVELERIVDEQPTEQVPSDEHCPARELPCRGEGVGRAELCGRRFVRGELHSQPRPVGSVQQKASAWVP